MFQALRSTLNSENLQAVKNLCYSRIKSNFFLKYKRKVFFFEMKSRGRGNMAREGALLAVLQFFTVAVLKIPENVIEVEFTFAHSVLSTCLKKTNVSPSKVSLLLPK